jgi:hypothetical protein
VVVQELPFKFVIDRQQQQQFDEIMTVEADPGYPSYKITGSTGLFSSNVRLQDLRSATIVGEGRK